MKYPISSHLFENGKTYNSSGKLWVLKERKGMHLYLSFLF